MAQGGKWHVHRGWIKAHIAVEVGSGAIVSIAILLALRQHFRKSYRDFCEVIEVCTEILDELGLKRCLTGQRSRSSPGVRTRGGWSASSSNTWWRRD